MKKVKLFTFPYAGGNSNVFIPWKKQLNNKIELQTIELSGRGNRTLEPLNNSIEEIVIDLQNIFIENNSDYAMFGHSMGALIVFELLSSLKRNGIKLPFHVFFSGMHAPHFHAMNKKNYHQMNSKEFKDAVLQLGGTPIEVFENSELASLFLPILKNDFNICDNYIPNIIDEKYKINFSILAGLDEKYEETELTDYEHYTTGETTISYFNGGHFFIRDSQNEVIELINSTLQKYTKC